MDPVTLPEKLREVLAKYKYAFLVLLLGIGLMLLPMGTGTQAEEPPEQAISVTEPETLEDRMEKILSQISGAGRVSVLLTLKTGEETHYQEDGQKESGGESSRSSSDTVLVENEYNRESGLVRRVDPPVYLGAVIVCQGGDDPRVRLAIVEAVQCATGLGANQISVIKMN